MKQVRLWLLSLVVLAASAIPAAAQSDPVPSPSFFTWARTNAIPIRPVDEPYTESSYAFLRPLVGSARILAVGEWMHWAHEPLQFRNHVIRYAVNRLGFTAVALESGFTPGTLVDDFVQGGPGNIDSVLKNGLTTRFGELPENRELVLWLREHNARTTRKVRFYGMDLSGGAPNAVLAALGFLEQVAPSVGDGLSSRFRPLMSRLTEPGYTQSTPAERDRVGADLEQLHRTLIADSSRFIRASSKRHYAGAVRNAWMALRLYEYLAVAKGPRGRIGTSDLADTVKFENIKWMLDQAGSNGRIVVHAANAHIMNNSLTFPNMGTTKQLGAYLRPWFGKDVVILGAAAHHATGFQARDGVVAARVIEGVPSDSTSFGAVLARVGVPNFVLDLRTADRLPDVAAVLSEQWLFRTNDPYRINVREATDAVVYFDKVSRTKGPEFGEGDANAEAAASTPGAAPRLESQTSGTTVRLVGLSIVSPTVAWVSGARGTYLRTMNGGKTWQAAVVPGADSVTYADVHATSADHAVLLGIGYGEQSRIYRTTDGGNKWTMCSSAGRLSGVWHGQVLVCVCSEPCMRNFIP